MNKRFLWAAFLLALSLVAAWSMSTNVVAQDASVTATPTDLPLTPIHVEIAAEGGIVLVGDYYALSAEPPAPAVLLMHMNNSNRGAWSPLIPPLLNAGYNALAVDLRGFGESSGTRDMQAAIGDTAAWLGWLREQSEVDPDRIGTIGASIGANLAIVGCANDPQCVTAIGLSPGLTFFNVLPETAVVEGLVDRSVLLVSAQMDPPSTTDVKHLITVATGEIGLHLYPGTAHGTALFESTGDPNGTLTPLIITWLNNHLHQN
jgi:pimeloyl-ACP methyl ester carboxylesterase